MQMTVGLVVGLKAKLGLLSYSLFNLLDQDWIRIKSSGGPRTECRYQNEEKTHMKANGTHVGKDGIFALSLLLIIWIENKHELNDYMNKLLTGHFCFREYLYKLGDTKGMIRWREHSSQTKQFDFVRIFKLAFPIFFLTHCWLPHICMQVVTSIFFSLHLNCKHFKS